MTMAFFIHQAIIAMTTASNPDTRKRDTGFAYVLACATYLYFGVTVYATFPYHKENIKPVSDQHSKKICR